MTHGLKKAWLWTKLAFIVLVVAWVVLFFVFNRASTVTPYVWVFFGTQFEAPVNLLVPVTALAAIVIFSVIRKIHGVLRELTQVRQADQAKEREQKMEDLVRQVDKLSSSGNDESRK